MYLMPFCLFHKWMCLSRWCERLFLQTRYRKKYMDEPLSIVIIGHWPVLQNTTQKKRNKTENKNKVSNQLCENERQSALSALQRNSTQNADYNLMTLCILLKSIQPVCVEILKLSTVWRNPCHSILKIKPMNIWA